MVLVGVGVGRCFDADGDLGSGEFLLLGWRLREELGRDFGFQRYEVFGESVCVVGWRVCIRDVGAGEVDFHRERHEHILLVCGDEAVALQDLIDAACDGDYERFNSG